ncbi:hypothetical protein TNCV_5014881 [Trichonephila clavipes]|nr:hypothetical protein TNCV_5014881 [Trichonephila clavipes]
MSRWAWRSKKGAGLPKTERNCEKRKNNELLGAQKKKILWERKILRNISSWGSRGFSEVEMYGISVMSGKQMWFWCTEFDKDKTDVRDEEKAGRPKRSITDDKSVFRPRGSSPKGKLNNTLCHGPTESTGLDILSKLARLGQRKQVRFQWIPSHVGVVPGNEAADELAGRGL